SRPRSCTHDLCASRLRLPAGSTHFPYPPLFRSCAVMTFLTEVTSNTAMTSLFLPILLAASTAAGLDPRLLMLPATLSASCAFMRSEEHTSELQSRENLVCRLLLEKKRNPATWGG